MLVDLHTHPQAHGEGQFKEDNLEAYIRTALNRGCRDLGFSDHDLYLAQIDREVISKLQMAYPQINLRIGLEVDFRPGTDWDRHLASYSYDYLIGSVHEIDRWPFDHPDYLAGYQEWQGDDLYEAYFNLVKEAAQTGRFQVIGHLDVIGVFGFKPQRPVLDFATPALRTIRELDLAIELNTAGRYKPAGHYYPAKEILAEAYRLGIPVTLGSDAHEEANVARDFGEAVELLKAIGYKSIVTFANKERIFYPL